MVDPNVVRSVFEDSGESDIDYLCHHMDRFISTFERFDSTWDRNRGVRLLDIGAHWLHQSMVFKLGGYDVIAADLPITLEIEGVKNLAREHDIQLVSYLDLSAPDCLKDIPSDSVNVVLMSEIIEHITFNPIAMWKEIYRVITPGGRVIVTTPNFYRTGGRAWGFSRFFKGYGIGITTHEILSIHTTGHHWKEFSKKELQHYFCMLSPDFNCVKAEFTNNDGKNPSKIQQMFAGLRRDLHLEFEVTEKKHGIVVEPGW